LASTTCVIWKSTPRLMMLIACTSSYNIAQRPESCSKTYVPSDQEILA